jgi:hypothetical protein
MLLGQINWTTSIPDSLSLIPASPQSSGTLAIQRRRPLFSSPSPERTATDVRGRDEGGGAPFPFPQALLPTVGGLVGSVTEPPQK